MVVTLTSAPSYYGFNFIFFHIVITECDSSTYVYLARHLSLKMPETTVPTTSPAKAKKVATKKAKPADHPKYSEMIIKAISELKDRKGSSRQAIAKFVKANNKVKDNADVHLKTALRRGVAAGALKQTKGKGASGSFKVADKPKTTKPKKTAAKKKTKKPAAKKPKSAKKTPKKKVTKKPAAAKKPVAKKPAAKKASKKPAAKKPAAKKAASTSSKKKATGGRKAKK